MSTTQARTLARELLLLYSGDIVPNSDKCISTHMAGAGCTLSGKAMVLMPGAGYEGVTRFGTDVMTSYGLNACPPLLVGGVAI